MKATIKQVIQKKEAETYKTLELAGKLYGILSPQAELARAVWAQYYELAEEFHIEINREYENKY